MGYGKVSHFLIPTVSIECTREGVILKAPVNLTSGIDGCA